MSNTIGDAADRERSAAERLEAIRSWRDDPQWRPGAMRPEERERLVRIALSVVMGDRARALEVYRSSDDSIVVRDPDQHSFGFPPDVALGDDPRVVLEHDLEWLVHELCMTSVAWAEQVPICPLHPGSHPLTLAVTQARVAASCPSTGMEIRAASYSAESRPQL